MSMSKEMKRESRTLDNIMKAIDAKPVHIPWRIRVKQWYLKLLSNRIFAITVKSIPILVLLILLFHTFASVSKIGNREFNIKEHHVEDGYLYITVENASIDEEQSYMVATNGDTVYHPTLKGIRDNTAVFKFDGNSYNIYLYSTDGRALQLLIDGQ